MQIYYVYMAVFPLICLSLMMVKTVAQHKKEFIEKHGYPGGGGAPGACCGAGGGATARAEL